VIQRLPRHHNLQTQHSNNHHSNSSDIPTITSQMCSRSTFQDPAQHSNQPFQGLSVHSNHSNFLAFQLNILNKAIQNHAFQPTSNLKSFMMTLLRTSSLMMSWMTLILGLSLMTRHSRPSVTSTSCLWPAAQQSLNNALLKSLSTSNPHKLTTSLGTYFTLYLVQSSLCL